MLIYMQIEIYIHACNQCMVVMYVLCLYLAIHFRIVISKTIGIYIAKRIFSNSTFVYSHI